MLHFNSLFLFAPTSQYFSKFLLLLYFLSVFIFCFLEIPEVMGAFLWEIESITAGSESQRPQRQKHHRRVLQADSREALLMLQQNQPFATTSSNKCCTEVKKQKKKTGFVSLSNSLTFKHMTEYVRQLQVVQCSEVITRLFVAT